MRGFSFFDISILVPAIPLVLNGDFMSKINVVLCVVAILIWIGESARIHNLEAKMRDSCSVVMYDKYGDLVCRIESKQAKK